MSQHARSGLLFLLSVTLCAWTLGGEVRVDEGQRILLLATERSSTMADEIRQAAEFGFQILLGAPNRRGEITYLLERGDWSLPPDTYHLLATRRLQTMEQELNATAEKGYRLLPRSVQWPECEELILVMEKSAAEDPRWQYLILGTQRTSTLQKELVAAAQQGYEVMALLGGSENVVILERRAPE